ncbi:hypothetical protein BpHYR1_032354 [Brachionus plicatilis]|uniref:Uncharacterized protein n=1 Tax=Brachionus plicatilis TaxID=10195 RepID=A0A3M7RU52_BRAPC|nr:hypothetical protein BpHYR1_032354 [Brachionus plicatilis]
MVTGTQRWQIIGLLKDKTKSHQEIADLGGVSRKCVFTAKCNYEKTLVAKELPRSGRPRKLTNLDESCIFRKFPNVSVNKDTYSVIKPHLIALGLLKSLKWCKERKEHYRMVEVRLKFGDVLIINVLGAALIYTGRINQFVYMDTLENHLTASHKQTHTELKFVKSPSKPLDLNFIEIVLKKLIFGNDFYLNSENLLTLIFMSRNKIKKQDTSNHLMCLANSEQLVVENIGFDFDFKKTIQKLVKVECKFLKKEKCPESYGQKLLSRKMVSGEDLVLDDVNKNDYLIQNEPLFLEDKYLLEKLNLSKSRFDIESKMYIA